MTRRRGPRRLIFGEDRLPKKEAETAPAWPPLPAEEQYRVHCLDCDYESTGGERVLFERAHLHAGRNPKHRMSDQVRAL